MQCPRCYTYIFFFNDTATTEIYTLSLHDALPISQVSLLRVLQERESERVGGSHPIAVDVPVLAATNRDLEAAVERGTFREDLFYRLNVFPIRLPRLRERADDIPILVEYIVDRFAKQTGKIIRNIEKQTMQRLTAYDWPGNVRELDRKSTRLNSSHSQISYAVFCLKKKKQEIAAMDATCEQT